MRKRWKKLVFLMELCAILTMSGCGGSRQLYFSDAQSSAAEEPDTEAGDAEVETGDPETENSEAETVETETVKSAGQKVEEISVYLCGAVVHPGVYQVPEGSRICDVLSLAGGFLEGASQDTINQAQLLTDEEMIRIPTLEEAEALEAEPDVAIGKSSEDSSGDSQEHKININTATREELMTLSGIGETRADSIITYRENTKSFESIEDIKNIEGIKDGVFEKIKDEIRVN